MYKTSKFIKRWYYSTAHWQLGDAMVSDITFLWFLLFSMCHSLHVAVNKCINWCFVHLFLTVAKPLITVTYYPMAWMNKPDDTRQAWRHRWSALLTLLNKIPFLSTNGHINKQTNIARITRLIQAQKIHFNNANLTNHIIAVIKPLRKMSAPLVVNRVLANFWQKFYKFRCQGNESQPW